MSDLPYEADTGNNAAIPLTEQEDLGTRPHKQKDDFLMIPKTGGFF
jgi:hypothetical protein